MALKDLTPAQREQATSAYPTMSVTQIARQLGVSYHSIRELMHQTGQICPRPVYKKRIIPTDNQRQSIATLYQTGSTTKELATQFDISIATVANILKKQGFDLTRKALNQQQKDYILEQYAAGVSSKAIARTIGFSDIAILTFLESSGIERRTPNRYTDEQARQIVQDYEAGESSESIAKRFGVSANCTLETLKKYGVTIRDRRIIYNRPSQPLFEPKFTPQQLPSFKHPGIYKFTNLLNGKVYIGSAKNIYDRYYGHSEMRAPGLFTKALKKYGIGGFDFAVLERVNDLSKLVERETHWVEIYKALDRNFGYNLIKPRECRREKRTPETRAKISAALRGRTGTNPATNR